MAEIDISWVEEADGLYNETAKLVLSIFQAGGKVGQGLLPKAAQVLVDWDIVNQSALDYLKTYRLATVEKISEVTRRYATRAIEDWMQSGEPLDALIARLDPWLGPERAARIAVTEVTRTYATGNQMAWMSTGLVGSNQWLTAVDERVCPICGPLHGIVVPLGEGFTPDGPGLGPTAPPAHTNCRCWLQPVVDEDRVASRIRGILG